MIPVISISGFVFIRQVVGVILQIDECYHARKFQDLLCISSLEEVGQFFFPKRIASCG